MGDHNHKYKAFISYSHTDERSARWLHRAIESYRLPKSVANRIGLSSRRLRPVFRDRDELASSADLSEEIQQALLNSESLIVICSRAAAASPWVCREIEYFAQHRGLDRVLCVIVEPFDEFPPPLTSQEPLAADARPKGDGRDRAKLKVIAGMLDIRFDELARRDRQQRRSVMITRGATFSVAMAAAAGLALWIGAPERCPDPLVRVASAWNDERRGQLASAFASTGLPYALETARKVAERLDSYALRWRQAHVAACEATHVSGSQSGTLLDKRMQCLDNRLLDIDAMATRFSTADLVMVEHATDAVARMPQLQDCADSATLAASYPPPIPGQAEQVLILQRQVADASAAFLTGQMVVAERVLAAALPDVERIDYPPLSAASLKLEGQIRAELTDPALVTSFEKGLMAAARAHNDAVHAEIWIAYVFALSEALGRLDDAENLQVAASVATARLGSQHYLVASLANLEGAIAIRKGDLHRAREALSRALELGEQETHPQKAFIKSNLAIVLKDLAEFDAARGLALEAYTDLVERHGAQHPATTEPLMTLAGIEEELGNPASALGYMLDVLELRRNAYGPENESVALTWRAVGWMQKEIGQLKEASASMKQSLAIYQQLDDPPRYQVANLLNALGDLAVYEGNLGAAEDSFRDSIEIWQQEYPGNPNLAIPLTNLGMLLNRLDNSTGALELCARTRAIDEDALGADHPDMAFSLTCMGEALVNLERNDEARELLEHAVELRAKAKQWELGWSMFQLGRAHWQGGARDQAQSLMEEAAALLRLEPGPDPYYSESVARWRLDHSAAKSPAIP